MKLKKLILIILSSLLINGCTGGAIGESNKVNQVTDEVTRDANNVENTDIDNMEDTSTYEDTTDKDMMDEETKTLNQELESENGLMLERQSNRIILKSPGNQVILYKGDTRSFNLEPEIINIKKDNKSNYYLLYYGSRGLGSPSLRTYGHIVGENIKKSSIDEIYRLSSDEFNLEKASESSIAIGFDNNEYEVNLEDYKNKYEQGELSKRTSFEELMASELNMVQTNIYLDKSSSEISVDYHVKSIDYNMYLFSFTCKYSLEKGEWRRSISEISFEEGRLLDLEVLTQKK